MATATAGGRRRSPRRPRPTWKTAPSSSAASPAPAAPDASRSNGMDPDATPSGRSPEWTREGKGMAQQTAVTPSPPQKGRDGIAAYWDRQRGDDRGEDGDEGGFERTGYSYDLDGDNAYPTQQARIRYPPVSQSAQRMQEELDASMDRGDYLEPPSMMVENGNDGDEREEDDEVMSIQKALQRFDSGLGGRGGGGAAASSATGDDSSLVRNAVQGWEGASPTGSSTRRSQPSSSSRREATLWERQEEEMREAEMEKRKSAFEERRRREAEKAEIERRRRAFEEKRRRALAEEARAQQAQARQVMDGPMGQIVGQARTMKAQDRQEQQQKHTSGRGQDQAFVSPMRDRPDDPYDGQPLSPGQRTVRSSRQPQQQQQQGRAFVSPTRERPDDEPFDSHPLCPEQQSVHLVSSAVKRFESGGERRSARYSSSRHSRGQRQRPLPVQVPIYEEDRVREEEEEEEDDEDGYGHEENEAAHPRRSFAAWEEKDRTQRERELERRRRVAEERRRSQAAEARAEEERRRMEEDVAYQREQQRYRQRRSSQHEQSQEQRQRHQEQEKRHWQEQGRATEGYDEDEDNYEDGDGDIDHERSDFSASPREELRKISEAVQRWEGGGGGGNGGSDADKSPAVSGRDNRPPPVPIKTERDNGDFKGDDGVRSGNGARSMKARILEQRRAKFEERRRSDRRAEQEAESRREATLWELKEQEMKEAEAAKKRSAFEERRRREKRQAEIERRRRAFEEKRRRALAEEEAAKAQAQRDQHARIQSTSRGGSSRQERQRQEEHTQQQSWPEQEQQPYQSQSQPQPQHLISPASNTSHDDPFYPGDDPENAGHPSQGTPRVQSYVAELEGDPSHPSRQGLSRIQTKARPNPVDLEGVNDRDGYRDETFGVWEEKERSIQEARLAEQRAKFEERRRKGGKGRMDFGGMRPRYAGGSSNSGTGTPESRSERLARDRVMGWGRHNTPQQSSSTEMGDHKQSSSIAGTATWTTVTAATTATTGSEAAPSDEVEHYQPQRQLDPVDESDHYHQQCGSEPHSSSGRWQNMQQPQTPEQHPIRRGQSHGSTPSPFKKRFMRAAAAAAMHSSATTPSQGSTPDSSWRREQQQHQKVSFSENTKRNQSSSSSSHPDNGSPSRGSNGSGGGPGLPRSSSYSTASTDRASVARLVARLNAISRDGNMDPTVALMRIDSVLRAETDGLSAAAAVDAAAAEADAEAAGAGEADVASQRYDDAAAHREEESPHGVGVTAQQRPSEDDDDGYRDIHRQDDGEAADISRHPWRKQAKATEGPGSIRNDPHSVQSHGGGSVAQRVADYAGAAGVVAGALPEDDCEEDHVEDCVEEEADDEEVDEDVDDMLSHDSTVSSITNPTYQGPHGQHRSSTFQHARASFDGGGAAGGAAGGLMIQPQFHHHRHHQQGHRQGQEVTQQAPVGYHPSQGEGGWSIPEDRLAPRGTQQGLLPQQGQKQQEPPPPQQQQPLHPPQQKELHRPSSQPQEQQHYTPLQEVMQQQQQTQPQRPRSQPNESEQQRFVPLEELIQGPRAPLPQQQHQMQPPQGYLPQQQQSQGLSSPRPQYPQAHPQYSSLERPQPLYYPQQHGQKHGQQQLPQPQPQYLSPPQPQQPQQQHQVPQQHQAQPQFLSPQQQQQQQQGVYTQG
mmetsp:Transcript_23444/g.69425  ORF Transcript_23444/g.69425 Transcript_23444/m.69425 type:complete len:1649 (-) Transcript_23444:29-4975(-)